MNAQRGRQYLGRWTRRAIAPPRLAVALLTAALAASLVACSGGGSVNIANSQLSDPATVDFPIFYVKRQVPLNSNGTVVQDDLRVLRDAAPSADLYKRATASPSATETNITARLTAGARWDVKDVDTSPDGTRVVFAMRGPLAVNQDPSKPPSWRIYEYVIASDTLRTVIDPATDPTVNDVSPHYLPDGRIVFSSTRQTQSRAILLDEGKQQFAAQDEAGDEPAFVLEVMNADGTGAHQISFNQSHDRDATVLANGRVLWSRWDHAPGKDAMSLYSANPDGTDLELYYGANSHMTGTNNTVVEFVQPREMQDGRILALERQYTNVDFGGNLVIIDGTHFVENTQPLLANAGLPGPAQTPATPNDVRTIPGPSPGGRFNSAYPLHDGTGRILVSWTQCRLLDTTQTPPAIVPCTPTALAAPNPQAAPPLYSVWMFDPKQNTLMPIMQPVEGVMVTDVAVAQPRALPNIILDKVAGVDFDSAFVTAGVGVLDIKSVYDFDGMDTAMPNIQTVADPSKTPPIGRQYRFIRLEKAVSIPDKDLVNLAAAAFGPAGYMREIMGYAPIEPDGSVRINVPANVAFQISVLDANGRRNGPIQGVWLQLQNGEVLACNGCHTPAGAQNTPAGQTPHSHGRANLFTAVYSGSTSGGPFPNANPAFSANSGETMAETRTRTNCKNSGTSWCALMNPSVDVVAAEVWANPPATTPDVSLRYADLPAGEMPPTNFSDCVATAGTDPTGTAGQTKWSSHCRIVINYSQHIQKLWDQPRTIKDPSTGLMITAACSSAGCHDATGAASPNNHLNLTTTPSNDEPLQPISYRDLLFQHNVPDANGNPVSVGPYMDWGSANGTHSRAFLGRFAPGSPSTHANWLTPAELRLISEWLDIGAQFFNNPVDPAVPVN